MQAVLIPCTKQNVNLDACACTLVQDVGFDGINPTPGTDFNVINKYFTEFFPQAV